MAENQDRNRSGGDTSNRGFASMDDDKQREISRKGGQSGSDQDRSKGGQGLSDRDRSKGGQNQPDSERSFSQDRDLASEAGRKGGESSGGGRS
jgi:uncharacterized protein